MAIEVFDNDDFRGEEELIITLDKSKRIYLSKPVQEFFGVDDPDKSLTVYLGYDSVNKRICLAKPDVVRIPGKRPVTFGKFKFISARRFIDRFQIDLTDAPLHYRYVGQDGDWYCFQLVGYKAPDLKNIE
jgi:hypothetical protein